MATPVVTVASGGLPVVDATSGGRGMPVTEASTGRGTAVTKVAAGGIPVVYSTVADYPSGGGGGPGVEAAAFLARTSGLDTTHTNAYTALINGLVADGIWAKLDMLHFYATQDATTALLNLVSTSYTGIANGSPVFTVDRGYVGVESSGTVYINTNFRPDTAVSPKFTQNSGHVSAWVPTDTGASSSSTIGVVSNGSTSNTAVFPLVAGNTAHFRVNSGGFTGTPVPTSAGHSLANRSDANSVQGYKNGVGVFSTSSSTSAAVSPHFIVTLGVDNFNTVVGSSHKVAMASIGSSLSAGDATAFYNRLRTYMTSVGVP